MAVKEPKVSAKREPEYIDKPSPFSIEGIRSGAVQSRVVKAMIVLSGIIMAGTFAISSLTPTGVPQNGEGGAQQNPTETVATVGDQTITAGQLNNAFARSIQLGLQYGFGSKPTVATFLDQKQGALRQLSDNAALIVAAQKAGITVSDADIDKELDKQIRTEFKPQPGQSEAAFLRLIQTQYKVGSVDEAINQELAKVTQDGRDQIRKQLLVQKLEQQFKDANKVTEDDYKRSLTKLDLYQIVLQPELPKGNVKDFVAEQKKLQDANEQTANKLVTQLKANPTLANFKAVATKESDDKQTNTKGGALGLKLPKEVSPSDPAVADALSKTTQSVVGPFKGQLDGSETIYFIAGRKLDLPKDYNKNKKSLLTAFETQQDNDAWQKQQDDLQKQVTPDVSDPAMAAYQLQNKELPSKNGAEQTKMREDIISRYDDALKTTSGMEAASINFQKANLYRDLGQKVPQMEALKAAAAAVKNNPDPGLLIAYGQSLNTNGQPKAALEQFKAASKAMDDNPSAPSPFGGNPDDAMRQQLAQQFQILKEPKLAAAETAKIKPSAPAVQGASNIQLGGASPGLKVIPQ